jgi:hypothetical protein
MTIARHYRFGCTRQAGRRDGNCLINGGTVAQLSFPIGAPAFDRSTGDDRTGVRRASPNGTGGRNGRHRHRVDTETSRVVAEHTVAFCPPTPQGPIGQRGTRRCIACDQRSDPGQRGYGHGRVAIGLRTIAQLPIAIVAPALHRRIPQQGTGILIASHDRGRGRDRRHGRWNILGHYRAVSNHTLLIVAPALDRSTGNQRTREVSTRSQGRHTT